MVNVALVFLRRRVNCLVYLLHPDMTPGTVSSSGNCQLSATTPHRLSYSRCWSCWSCACCDCGARRGHILVRPTPSSLYLVPLPGIRVLLQIFSSSHIISHPTQTLTTGWFTVCSTASGPCVSSVRLSSTMYFPMSSFGPSSHFVRVSHLSCTCLCLHMHSCCVASRR
jgi:hypothetical protein